ncbi:MAG: flavoprotein [Bilophila wadsworthia]
MKKRLVVGLSPASSAILCVSLLEAMRKGLEVHLVTSEAGERVLHEETGMSGTRSGGAGLPHAHRQHRRGHRQRHL